MFSRLLLPQRGQKCNASPFAEDSFDGVADPVITSNPAVAHVGGRNRFRAASHSSRIGGFAARRSFSDRSQSVNTSAFVGTNPKEEPTTSGLPVIWEWLRAIKSAKILKSSCRPLAPAGRGKAGVDNVMIDYSITQNCFEAVRGCLLNRSRRAHSGLIARRERFGGRHESLRDLQCEWGAVSGIVNVTVLDCPGKTLWLVSTNSIFTLGWPGGSPAMSTVLLSLASAHHQGRSSTIMCRCPTSSPSNEEDEVIARICELTHRLGYNQAKTKMLLGQSARYLVSLERSLLNELEDLPDGIPNSLATSSRHEKPSSVEGFLSLDDKLIRRYE